REPGKRLDDLEGAADARGADLVGAQPVDRLSGEEDSSGVWREHAGDHVEDRRLSRAVRADQRVDSSLGEGERGVRDRSQSPEGLADALDGEEVHSLSLLAIGGQMPFGRNAMTASSTTP